MTTAGSSKRAAVFVSYSLADPDADRIVRMLTDEFDVLDITDQPSELPTALALQGAIASADLALILLPREDDPTRANALFEAGLAAGIGLPVVLLSDGGPVPRALAGLPLVLKTDKSALVRTLRAQRRTPPMHRRIHRTPATNELWKPALTASQAKAARTTLSESLSGAELERWVANLFRDAGATVARTAGPSDIGRADVSVWEDRLQATFGLPLPVEVLRTTRELKPVLARLQRLMRASGSASLLAVSGVESGRCQRWVDTASLILFLDARLLVDALARKPLPNALAELLSISELTA